MTTFNESIIEEATQRDTLLPKLLSGELRPPSIPPIS
jgi:hypothetical protein